MKLENTEPKEQSQFLEAAPVSVILQEKSSSAGRQVMKTKMIQFPLEEVP